MQSGNGLPSVKNLIAVSTASNRRERKAALTLLSPNSFWPHIPLQQALTMFYLSEGTVHENRPLSKVKGGWQRCPWCLSEDFWHYCSEEQE